MSLLSSGDNKLVFDTFDEAVELNPDAHPLFHSDRGFQYTSKTFHSKLMAQNMRQSMSRVGRCIDNGPMEAFWEMLKSEMYYLKKNPLQRTSWFKQSRATYTFTTTSVTNADFIA